MKKILTLAIMALAMTALFAPAALAQDDDGFDDDYGYDDDDYGYVAPAAAVQYGNQYYDDADGDGYYDDDDGGGYVAPAASTQYGGGDDDDGASSAAPLPSTGGPMLLPLAGLLLLGLSVVGVGVVRRRR